MPSTLGKIYDKEERNLKLFAIFAALVLVGVITAAMYSNDSYHYKKEECYMNTTCPKGTFPRWYAYHEVCKCGND